MGALSETQRFWIMTLVFAVLFLILFLQRTPIGGRTSAVESKNIKRALWYHCGGRGKLFSKAALSLPGMGEVTFDHILVDQSGVLLLMQLEWGSDIQGSAKAKKWTLRDRGKYMEVDNPLLLMRDLRGRVSELLNRNGCRNVPVQSLVLCCAPYRKISVEAKSDEVLVSTELSHWLKARTQQAPACDWEQVAETLATLVKEK